MDILADAGLTVKADGILMIVLLVFSQSKR